MFVIHTLLTSVLSGNHRIKVQKKTNDFRFIITIQHGPSKVSDTHVSRDIGLVSSLVEVSGGAWVMSTVPNFLYFITRNGQGSTIKHLSSSHYDQFKFYTEGKLGR